MKELKDCNQLKHMQDDSHVESGEGIERAFCMGSCNWCPCGVESGEGIERMVRSITSLIALKMWNPVKELKDCRARSQTKPSRRRWNPVKELKECGNCG